MPATTNLLEAHWSGVESIDLRILLSETFGGPGQYSGPDDDYSKLSVPRADASCQVVLTFRDASIVAIEPGPAFQATKWEQLRQQVAADCLTARFRVGREYSFSTFRVCGHWRGRGSRVQILPPHSDAPSARVESAEHPFILEFPVLDSSQFSLVNHRRLREHRRLTRLLNLLLRGHVTHPIRTSRHLWALDIETPGSQARWVQEFFDAPLGPSVLDDLSDPSSNPIEVLRADEYYSKKGHDGRPLRVPGDLDQRICQYLALPAEHRRMLDRATYWLDLAGRHWYTSLSASFAALVSAVESMTERGDRHHFNCPVCGEHTHHEVPGATRRFREFLERFAPGPEEKPVRDVAYGLRSSILHGGKLMQFDDDREFGWDPPGWQERTLHRSVWALVQTALRGWLSARQ